MVPIIRVSILSRLVMWAIRGQPLGLFRYARKCVGVDRGLVPGGLSHWQPGGGSTGPASGSTRVSRGGSWYLAGSNLRSAKRGNGTPGQPPQATSASVLVSKSNSKGAMYGRMTDMAEREGGAGRAWTKGAEPKRAMPGTRSPGVISHPNLKIISIEKWGKYPLNIIFSKSPLAGTLFLRKN